MQLIIAGARGSGLKALQVVHDLQDAGMESYEIIGFIDDNNALKNTIFYDYPILGTTDELEKIQNRIGVLNEISLVCPVGNCKNRKMLIDKLSSHFTHFPNLIHPTAQISKHAELGEGNLFSQNVVIQPGAKIGNFNTFNIAAILGPLAEITDYCTINANVMVASESKILPFTYIGMGANIIQRINIGENCMIAANSLVTRSLPDDSRVIGIPARLMKKFG